VGGLARFAKATILASVAINGAFAGGFLGGPCRLEVTDRLRPGENVVEIAPRAPKAARLLVYPNVSRAAQNTLTTLEGRKPPF